MQHIAHDHTFHKMELMQTMQPMKAMQPMKQMQPMKLMQAMIHIFQEMQYLLLGIFILKMNPI